MVECFEVCWPWPWQLVDTTIAIAILNHRRNAVKIPTRSFLTDFGLVGASVLILACLVQPKSETWVASVQRADGTTTSVEVDERNRHQGDDVNKIRSSIIGELVPPENEKQGLVRWQSETSLFYAQADSQRLGSQRLDPQQLASSAQNNPQLQNRVFQTASHQPESLAESRLDDSATKWTGFWQRRGDQSADWLNEYSEFHQQRVARISKSLVVARVDTFLPARGGLLMAMLAALVTVVAGGLWCLWVPRRTLPKCLALNEPVGSAVEGSAAFSPTDEFAEPAAMSFRLSWVRLRQPFAVHARRACGWMIVLTAMIAVGQQLL